MEIYTNENFLPLMDFCFRVLRSRQVAPRATLANARPSENPGKLSSSALAWRRRLIALAACQARRAPVAPAGLASSPELKSFREEARAWVVGGGLVFSALKLFFFFLKGPKMEKSFFLCFGDLFHIGMVFCFEIVFSL